MIYDYYLRSYVGKDKREFCLVILTLKSKKLIIFLNDFK